jgi:hypothetical protein
MIEGNEALEVLLCAGNNGSKKGKMGGEGWRIGGSPARWPLCEQGTWTR